MFKKERGEKKQLHYYQGQITTDIFEEMSDNNIRSFSGEDYATAFTKALTCQINKEDVSCMVQTQKEMYV